MDNNKRCPNYLPSGKQCTQFARHRYPCGHDPIRAAVQWQENLPPAVGARNELVDQSAMMQARALSTLHQQMIRTIAEEVATVTGVSVEWAEMQIHHCIRDIARDHPR